MNGNMSSEAENFLEMETSVDVDKSKTNDIKEVDDEDETITLTAPVNLESVPPTTTQDITYISDKSSESELTIQNTTSLEQNDTVKYDFVAPECGDFSKASMTDVSSQEIILESSKSAENLHRDPCGVDTKQNSLNLNSANANNKQDKEHDSFQSKKLIVSTESLNVQKMYEIDSPEHKTSKSAENLPFAVESDSKSIDTNKVLDDYKAKKSRVTATHKIPPHMQPLLDAKNVKLNKEIIASDIGSIVKNVHSIFSSVSGSLKNAYHTNKSTPQQKPPPSKTTETIVNTSDETEKIPELTEASIINEATETESDLKKDIFKLQIESLERVMMEQRKEIATLRERVRLQADEMGEKDQVFKDLEGKMDLMRKRVEHAEREKDSAVMKYASSEYAVIEARKAAEAATKMEKQAVAEMELMAGKLKSAHADKQRICQLYDDKCHEVTTAERELAKTREDLKELEGRLKWTQSKLRMEMDAYKDSAEKVEKLSQQVSEAAKETSIVNATDFAKLKTLESELKESQAALILCRHEKDELEKKVVSLAHQLEVCKKERDAASSNLNAANVELDRLKESNIRLEEEAASLAGLSAKASLADTLAAELKRETTRVSTLESTLSTLQSRVESISQREAEALRHVAALTGSHVEQRDAAAREASRAQALSADNISLRSQVSKLEEDLTEVRTALREENERRNRENKAMARRVAELTEEVADLTKKLEWEKGENVVLKKKHASAIKELNRELQRALKRCEQLEAKIPSSEENHTRTGSVSSLSSSESPHPNPEERLQNGHTDSTVPDIQSAINERQTLIERIVSLQRAAARRAERCDFLEEHSRQLTEELRKKTRLLRHLLADAPAGALANTTSDHHKKEIVRHGGAMAAVWGGDPTGMTLDLSLEINNKLQAVLEDTILKNITLKENMDTLGKEIARLRTQSDDK